MIAIVSSWDGISGTAVMVWPRPGVPIRLSHESFPGYRELPKLAAGDRVAFGAVSSEGVAQYASPWVVATVDDDDKKVDRAPDFTDEGELPNRHVRMIGPVEVRPPWGFAPTPWTAPRRCLWCARVFLSAGPAERLCGACRPAENGV